jgi:hypothetical protein
VDDLKKLEGAESPQQATADRSEIEVSEISSPVLARLIEEVRNEESSTINPYNRFHNRHNRSR